MQRRLAQLPLHGGKAPRWLFARMAKLAGAVTMTVVEEYGQDEMLRRLADPWWFQAFGCVLGFDWHSSGVTTVTCGAMKEAQRLYGDDLGILVAGGKGGTSRTTPRQIAELAGRHGISHGDDLIFASRMSAKVDSVAVQDGYQIYAHSLFFTPSGSWCVVQQGMNEGTRLARRYHWLAETVRDFVCEPHAGVRDTAPADGSQLLLNLVAGEAGANRQACIALIHEHPDRLARQLRRWTEGPTLFAPERHPVLPGDINVRRVSKVLRQAHETAPEDFRALLGTTGVGPATARALSLLAELIHGAPAAHRDLVAPISGSSPQNRRWADYAYAHGGKDGTPFPVDRATYDRSIAVLHDALRKARLGHRDKTDALRRLTRFM